MESKISYRIVEENDKRMITDLLSKCFPNSSNIVETYDYLHHKNPLTNYKPVGLVAIVEKEIIAYRGYVVLPYFFNGNKQNIVIPSSTATHPKYQRKGILSKLIDKSFSLLNDLGYYLILNTSTNAKSTLANLKYNWKILGNKEYYFKKNLLSSNKILAKYKISDSKADLIDIVKNVTQNSTLYSSYKIKINLEDSEFINWIFNRENFLFTHVKNNNEFLGYISYKINGKTCLINHFDFCNNNRVLSYLLKYISITKKVSTFYCYGISNKSERASALRKNGFIKTNYPKIRKLINKEIYPFLIRPTIKDLKDNDFSISTGFDIRNVNDWDITGISNF